ncbi:YbaK/EbsC family protein [Sutterella massiliensis]|uniref:YbaK/EbsC family protein n=1 Tax=Sutterella massiliensis TaxID=1816689 RepID=A0ABS2DSP4_9BURK|nr:YbaK/EbsC family protein [Sutterella massiliensis]MBM6704336.1 YbaK/EbsC family protein [Sutterella massiliensis]
MSFEAARAQLERCGLADRILEFDAGSTATVALAAQKIGCSPEHIAKSVALLIPEGPIVIVTAGDAKIDNKKFKAQFHTKAKMVAPDVVESLVGHAPGAVSPFGVKPEVVVWLDGSLRRFETVYPACGTASTGVRLSIEELERAAAPAGWVDVTKLA